MSEKLSDIYIDISMDTARLLEAATSADIALGKVHKSAKDVASGMDSAEQSAEKLNTQMTKVAASVNNASKSMMRSRAIFQQVGYQIQDIAVQAQMGTNAFVIMGQQGSQLLSVFGPMGAIAGMFLAIGGALGTALLPNLFDSTTATEKLDRAQKALSDVLVENGDGAYTLSDKLAKLAKENEDLARSKITVAMIEARQAIKSAGDAINESFDKFDSFFSFLGTNANASVKNAIDELERFEKKGGDAAQAVNELGGSYKGAVSEINVLNEVSSNISEELGITKTEAVGLLKQLNEFEKNKSPESMKALATSLNYLSDKSNWSNDNLTKLTQSVESNANAAQEATSMLEAFKNILKDIAGAANAADKEIQGNEKRLQALVDATKRKADLAGKSAREQALYDAEHSKASQESIQNAKNEINQAYNTIEAEEKRAKAKREAEAEAKKAANEAKARAKQSENEQKRIVEQIDSYGKALEIAKMKVGGMEREAYILQATQRLGTKATEEQIAKLKELAGMRFDVEVATPKFNDLFGQYVDPTEKLKAEYDAKIAFLDQYAIAHADKTREIEATKAAIEAEYRQASIEAEWEKWKQSSLGAEMMGNAIEAMSSSASSAISGLLSGTSSLREAFQSVANTVLNSVISSLVELGLAQVKQIVIGQSAAQAATAAQIAQAATIASAYAPAASMVSLASYGANAAPAQAGIASTMALAQTMAIAGRKNGGPVSANSMYRVGENGQPEIFKASNGSQYMIPGNNGRVFSNKDVKNSGAGGKSFQMSVVNNITVNSDQNGNIDYAKLAETLSGKMEAQMRMFIAREKMDGGML